MSINPAYAEFLSFDEIDRRQLFAEAEGVLGMPARYLEKDFFCALALEALFNGRPADAPRALFKGGTSLSKAWQLISRFSEDVDISIFREDLGFVESVDELAAMGRRPRERILDGLRAACQDYLHSILSPQLGAIVAEIEARAGAPEGTLRIEAASMDEDPDGQTLFLTYRSLFPSDGYVSPPREDRERRALGPRSVRAHADYAVRHRSGPGFRLGSAWSDDDPSGADPLGQAPHPSRDAPVGGEPRRGPR